MTQPESRTVEEVFAETIWDALSDRGVLRIHADNPKELVDITVSILAAAKEHGLVIGEGELDALQEGADLLSKEAAVARVEPGRGLYALGIDRGVHVIREWLESRR